MATFTPSSQDGQNLIKKLSQGTYIDAFDYDMFEQPDTAMSLIMPFGNDILGFQQMAGYIGQDEMASDELAWFTTGRLSKSYASVASVGSVMTFPANHDIRVNDTLQVANAADTGDIIEVVVTDVATNDVTVVARTAAALPNATYRVIHIGTEFLKGTDAQTESLTRTGDRKTNKPIILKDAVTYTRSDMAQIVQFAEGEDTLWSIDTSDVEARFMNQQVMAGIFGKASAASSGAETANLLGMESLYDTIRAEGNTIAGAISGLADIQALTRMLTANKSPKDNLILQDLDFTQEITNALGGINRMDTNAYNFGSFANVGEKMLDLNFRGFDSDGFMFAYKPWDVLDDKMYFGAFDGLAAKPKGMIIPAGEVPNAKGEVLPYFSYVYRSGARRIVSRDGAVFGIGTRDEARLAYTTEFTVRTVSPKDFTLITE